MSNHIDTTTPRVITYVDPYPGKADEDAAFIACGRCGGRGYIAGFEHVDNAVCYGCYGAKGEATTVGVVRKREKARVRRENASERKLVARQEFHNQQMAAAEAQHPVLAGWHDAMADGHPFLSDLWTKAFDYELSAKQVAAAAKVLQARIDRDAARKAEKDSLAPVVPGRGAITGTVLMVKYQTGQFGDTWKMLVKDDRNFKLWGTVPAAVFDAQRAEVDEDTNPSPEALVGRKVAFTGTVEASGDDPTFGFYSRPAKAQLLAQA